MQSDDEKEMKKMEKIATEYGLQEEKKELSMITDERDRIIDKARKAIEEGGELLTKEEEGILKEIAGMYYNVYIKCLETLEEEKGGKDYERE